MSILYTDIDQKSCRWIEMLIGEGCIPHGDVWCRDITTIQPEEVAEYTQRHWFCGISGWPLALKLAGWPSTRRVDTASLPCQPFSVAGKRKGNADERHLWPVFARLVAANKPPTIFGEQVASKDGRKWLSGVFSDLEGMGYRRAGADLCAAGVGAPHIRQRLFWVANAADMRRNEEWQDRPRRDERTGTQGELGRVAERGAACGLGNATSGGCSQGHGAEQAGQHGKAGHWDRFTTIPCGDGKARRIEPGLAPLVDGLPRGVVPGGDPRSQEYAQATSEARVMRLRGYGNAINPIVAAEFIKAYLETGGQP